jgi:hypothetical protein
MLIVGTVLNIVKIGEGHRGRDKGGRVTKGVLSQRGSCHKGVLSQRGPVTKGVLSQGMLHLMCDKQEGEGEGSDGQSRLFFAGRFYAMPACTSGKRKQ